MSVVRLVARKAAPAAPRGVSSKAAREEWERLAPILRERGALPAEREPLLIAYVNAMALIAEIDRELGKRSTKLVIAGPAGTVRAHPLIGARNKASQNALQLAKRLGIVGGPPLGKPGEGGQDVDPLSDLGI